MTIARCKLPDCAWQQERPTMEEALKLLRHHEAFRHPDVYGAATNQPLATEPVHQLADVDWWTQAIDVIAAQPARRRFTLYEICSHLGEPPTSNGWQNLVNDAKHLGLIVKVGGAESKRPGTRKSMTGLWERTEKAHTARRSA